MNFIYEFGGSVCFSVAPPPPPAYSNVHSSHVQTDRQTNEMQYV